MFPRILIIYPVLLFACVSVPNEPENGVKYHVIEATEWSELFIRQEGWFGGDGIFVIPLDQDTARQLIIFSDTMLGSIKEGVLQKGYHMVNNSAAIIEGKHPDKQRIQFPVPTGENGEDLSLFPVQLDEKEAGEYYWLGDGFRNPVTGDIHLFAYRVVDRPESPDMFKFEVLGGAVITLPSGSEFPFEDQHQVALPFFENNSGWITSFGAGIFENLKPDFAEGDGFIYVYGIRDPDKQVIVARVEPLDFLNFDAWRFWGDGQWSDDFRSSTALADSASNELSVSRLPNGEYAMIFQLAGIYPTVGMRVASSPQGPFGKMIPLWDCSGALDEKEFFTYNAKAHPTISAPGELLISYNVNSFAFWNQIETYPNLYRPRFIKLLFE